MDSRLILVAVVAYVLGSIPFGYILVKLFLKQDIRQTGSGNIGATNVARSGKKGLAIATLMLDAAKGFLAVQAARLMFPASEEVGYVEGLAGVAAVSAAFFAVLGHCFPLWLRFKGGKGVATAIGAFLVVAPLPAACAVVSFAIIFGVTRYVSLGSVIAALLFPALAYFNLQPLFREQLVAWMAATSALVILKHHANIRRLLAGTEPKFGKRAIGTTDPIQTEKNI
jgi:acyl phosphate:glycerol-3-phosphate acyltransferase